MKAVEEQENDHQDRMMTLMEVVMMISKLEKCKRIFWLGAN